MQKLADISMFESLGDGTASTGTNTIFNLKYPKDKRIKLGDLLKIVGGLGAGVGAGYGGIIGAAGSGLVGGLAGIPIGMLLGGLEGTAVGGMGYVLIKGIESLNMRRQKKVLEKLVKDVSDKYGDLPGVVSAKELKKDYHADRMNKYQYLALLNKIVFENYNYRSEDYDDPESLGPENKNHPGMTISDYDGSDLDYWYRGVRPDRAY